MKNHFPDLHFVIENDAKCAGLAEKKFGAAKNFSDFILLTFGTGIGGVIFSGNQILYGRDGGAGEIGHMMLHQNGRQCGCGNRGCFEKYCSAKSFENLVSEKLGFEITAHDIMARVKQNDQNILPLFNEYCENLSSGIISLVHIFNPEAILFGGGLFTTGGHEILTSVREKINGRMFPSFARDLQLLPSSLHGQAGLTGAASLVL